MTKSIALLGATGSIGTQVLDVVAAHPDHFRVAAMACGENVALFAAQVQQFQPEVVSVGSEQARASFKQALPAFKGELLVGEAGLKSLATLDNVDMVAVGLVGFIGLAPTLAALKAGKQVCTANKETFVAGGHLVAPFLNQVVPIDSEHSAIHQCLKGESPDAVQKLLLTASGGPFLKCPLEELSYKSPAQALKHPNWVMGSRITIDSATLMNKGLEVIEAHWLFQQPYHNIEVVIHPQSMIHSGVELIDGSILVQMGAPDMRLPIQYAMAYPQRLTSDYPNTRLDLRTLSQLQFDAPCLERFPCLGLAYEAGKMAGGATGVLNAADELAVARFLREEISFGDIPKLLEAVLSRYCSEGLVHDASPSLETLQQLDAWARQMAQEYAPSVTPQTTPA